MDQAHAALRGGKKGHRKNGEPIGEIGPSLDFEMIDFR